MAFNTSRHFEHAQKGANGDISSLSGLTTPLSLLQGGTGTSHAFGTSGLVLTSDGDGTTSWAETDPNFSNLTDISGTADVGGWSEGDRFAIADSSDSDNEKLIALPAELGLACSDEVTTIEDPGTLATLLIPRAMRLMEVKLSLTEQDDYALEFDLEYNPDVDADPDDWYTITYPSMEIPAETFVATFTGSLTGTTPFYSLGAEPVGYFDLDKDSQIRLICYTASGGTGTYNAKGLKLWLLGHWK